MASDTSTLDKVLAGIVIVYLVMLGGLLAAPLVIARTEMRGLVSTALVLLLFPSLVLLPLYLILRRWKWAALLAVPFVAFFLGYGPVLLPRSPEAPASAHELTVLTFNVQRADENTASIERIIRQADADVVGLQELSQPAADSLSTALANEYPHQALYGRERGHLGQGVFSRYPITDSDYWRNSAPEAIQLGQMWAQLDVNGRAVTFFSVHPLPPYTTVNGFNIQQHHEAILNILDRAANRCGPLILVGDWNMTDQFEDYDRVTQTYTDTFVEAGTMSFGFSYPNGKRFPAPPLARIDYIFHNEAFVGLDARVIPESGSSDHRPFYARLALLDESDVDLNCD